MMHRLFWFVMGAAMGALGYRYYAISGGRLPVMEQVAGRSTADVARDAQASVRTAKRTAKQAVTETTAEVATETVTAVAEEITEAERAKEREQAGGPHPI